MKDRIIEQLEKLISQGKKVRELTWWILFLAVLGVIMSLSILGGGLFQELDNNKGSPQHPPIESFSNLIEGLKNEPMTHKRFELLEANLDSIPSNLSLNQLRDCIDLFLPETYKLKVVRLLQLKVTDNYSDDELEGFKKLFSPYKQSEVEKLLPKRKK